MENTQTQCLEKGRTIDMQDKKEALANFHRSNILAAAEKLFSENGIEGTTMDNIAKAAQYSKATLYVYFRNKEEIISSITLISMRLFKAYITEALSEETDFFKQYYSLCNSIVAFHREHPLYFEALLKEINVDLELAETPPVYHDIYQAGEDINQVIGSLFEKGISQGCVRNDIRILETIYIFWASIAGIIHMSVQKEKCLLKLVGVTRDGFLDYSFETLLRSILRTDIVEV